MLLDTYKHVHNPSSTRGHRYEMGRTSSAQRRGHKRDGRMAGFDPIRGSTMQRNLLPSQPWWNHADSAVSVFGGHFQSRQAPLQSPTSKHNLPAPCSWMPSVTSAFTGYMCSNTASLALCPSVIRLASIPDLPAARDEAITDSCLLTCRRRTINNALHLQRSLGLSQRWKSRRLVIVEQAVLNPPPTRSFAQLLLK